jgi:hypothetical protein
MTAVLVMVALLAACSRTTNVSMEAPATTTTRGSALDPIPGNPTSADFARCEAEVQRRLDELPDVDLTQGIYSDYATTACDAAGPWSAPDCVALAIESAADFVASQTGPPEVTIPEAVQRESHLASCVLASISARGGPELPQPPGR